MIIFRLNRLGFGLPHLIKLPCFSNRLQKSRKGSFSSGIKALEALHEQHIDLIFLDIQMPDLTGIQLARTLENKPGNAKPRVIFTTAFNNYAIEGYKVDALDYLLKPYDYEEFLTAASKARTYTEMLNAKQPAADNEEYIFLKVEYQLVRVAIKDIVYIEGLKDYAKIHLVNEAKPLLSLITLKSLEEKLPQRLFMRVHRSFIISLDKIDAVTKNTVQDRRNKHHYRRAVQKCNETVPKQLAIIRSFYLL